MTRHVECIFNVSSVNMPRKAFHLCPCWCFVSKWFSAQDNPRLFDIHFMYWRAASLLDGSHMLTCTERRAIAGDHAITGQLHDQGWLLLWYEDISQNPGHLWQAWHHPQTRFLFGIPRHCCLQFLSLFSSDLSKKVEENCVYLFIIRQESSLSNTIIMGLRRDIKDFEYKTC